MQAPMFNGFSFGPFALLDNSLCAAGVGVGRCDVIQALLIELIVVVLDERFDLPFEIARQELVSLQDAVLEGLVSACRFTVRLQMKRCAEHVVMPCASIYSASAPAT